MKVYTMMALSSYSDCKPDVNMFFNIWLALIILLGFCVGVWGFHFAFATATCL